MTLWLRIDKEMDISEEKARKQETSSNKKIVKQASTGYTG